MGVTITDPLNNGSFPNDEGWTATVTIDSDDDVDGTLLDYATNRVYQDDGPICTGGPDAQGRYTWQVPFTHDSYIKTGHSLLIHCYDDETGSGASCKDTASENGRTSHKSESKGPGDGVPSISIKDNTELDKDAKTVTARVRLSAGTKGSIFLVLTNQYKNPEKVPSAILIHRYSLAFSDKEEDRVHTFKGIDESKWTHIHVIAVTKRHQGYPIVGGRPVVPVKTLKCP